MDDIWGIWKGSKEEFMSFVELCNGHEERIKVTFEICEKEAVFFYVKVSKTEEGEIQTGHVTYTRTQIIPSM